MPATAAYLTQHEYDATLPHEPEEAEAQALAQRVPYGGWAKRVLQALAASACQGHQQSSSYLCTGEDTLDRGNPDIWIQSTVLAHLIGELRVDKAVNDRLVPYSNLTRFFGQSSFSRQLVELALPGAVETDAETALLRAVEEIDWSQRPAVDLVRAVRLALALGAHSGARSLATRGAELHPDDSELRKMAHILAPPRLLNAELPPVPSVRANQSWLRDHADEYRGQWVALRDGALLQAGATAREVWDSLESTNAVTLIKVF